MTATSIGRKNKNLAEIKILLSVKFCSILFSGFKGEVDNVLANSRPGRPFWFSDRPENTNSVEDIEILLPVKFLWILFSSFREKVDPVHKAVSEKLKMSQPIRGLGDYFAFLIGPKKYKW